MKALRLAWISPFLALSFVAHADDGWVGNGGTPFLMKGKHPTIRMMDEHIRLYVGRKTTTVYCTFRFRNTGAATSVLMGFPDEGAEPDDASADSEDKPLSVFESFKSWVNDRAVQTKFQKDQQGMFWRSKRVHFKAHQTVVVRDVYTLQTGAGDETGRDRLYYAKYVMNTGSTWKGSIGHVLVDVRFYGFPKINRFADYADLQDKCRSLADSRAKVDAVMARNKHTLFYQGFGSPRKLGSFIRFEAKRLEPDEDDDIFLAFAPYKPAELQRP